MDVKIIYNTSINLLIYNMPYSLFSAVLNDIILLDIQNLYITSPVLHTNTSGRY